MVSVSIIVTPKFYLQSRISPMFYAWIYKYLPVFSVVNTHRDTPRVSQTQQVQMWIQNICQHICSSACVPLVIKTLIHVFSPLLCVHSKMSIQVLSVLFSYYTSNRPSVCFILTSLLLLCWIRRTPFLVSLKSYIPLYVFFMMSNGSISYYSYNFNYFINIWIYHYILSFISLSNMYLAYAIIGFGTFCGLNKYLLNKLMDWHMKNQDCGLFLDPDKKW